jgi:hypothetical protein
LSCIPALGWASAVALRLGALAPTLLAVVDVRVQVHLTAISELPVAVRISSLANELAMPIPTNAVLKTQNCRGGGNFLSPLFT